MNEKLIFAKNLNYYMARKGKTQADMVDELGINKSTMSTWCSGSKMPRMGTIQVLADYFGIMKSDLIEEKPPAEAEGNGDKAIVMKALRSLPPEGQKDLLEYIRFLLMKYGEPSKLDFPLEE